ncbi:unnamed protein product [Prorocentrum cordatum]|uniref:Uncharacterized protein n=1 Tax=Prorocentrum cordatum TaxID=2364126 RepID=A0ABN9QP57_9DINO|nr:unnamed protein product [Polarella glacialis]
MPAAEASEGKTGGDGAPVANDRISVVSADGHETLPSARKNRRGSSDDGAKSPKSATSRRRSCDSTASGRGKGLAYGDQTLQENEGSARSEGGAREARAGPSLSENTSRTRRTHGGGAFGIRKLSGNWRS